MIDKLNCTRINQDFGFCHLLHAMMVLSMWSLPCSLFLQGQVNQLLKSSEEQDHLPVESRIANDDCPEHQDIDDTTETASETDTGVVDKESVISATLKQLKSLGVMIDSPGKMKKDTHKVENAR